MKEFTSIEELESGNIILLFTTEWCGDCVALSMYIDDIVEENTHLTFYKVNSDNYTSLAKEYNVFGIPSFVALKDGEVIGDYIDKNAKPKDKIQKWLDELKY